MLHGGQLDDTIYGGANDGSGLHDWLYGDDGNDSLFGEKGPDVLDGGLGFDACDGGTGNIDGAPEDDIGLSCWSAVNLP